MAVVAVAFLAGAVLIKGIDPGPGLPVPTAPPRAAVQVASFEPTATPTASPIQDPPSLDPTVTPHPTAEVVKVAPGRTELVPAGYPTVRVSISVPAGWEQAGRWMYLKREATGPIGLSLGAYEIANVNLFPCRWASGRFTDTAPHTAAGLAEALSAFWGQDPDQTPFFSNSPIAPIATKPEPATLDGYPAWRLQILILSTFDFGACDGGQVVLWDTADGTVRSGLGPGEIDRLWVVDVNGELVVIDAALPLLASSSDTAELQPVVDSVRIGR